MFRGGFAPRFTSQKNSSANRLIRLVLDSTVGIGMDPINIGQFWGFLVPTEKANTVMACVFNVRTMHHKRTLRHKSVINNDY